MALASGVRLGTYEIVSPLGAGGMGEVYRARDSRLGREVALKILPDAVAADPERLARFEREAQVLASLNHPHIGAIYGVAEGEPSPAGAYARPLTALVLELVEGDTLADVIARGPVPLDDALTMARQMLEALESAHERGIVHRDLKPANVKITPDGRVKILDFGLAKLAAPPEPGGPPEAGHYVAASGPAGSRQPDVRSVRLQPDVGSRPQPDLQPGLTLSPTITSPAMQTGVGTLLGTAAYMAPEQARGKTVDRRADVWAFGCVLFEMLTGTRPFEGSDVTEVLASVIKGEPPWALLPPNTPPAVVTVLRRCLEKDPARRMRDCGDIRLALDGAFDVAAPPHASATTGASRRVMALLAAGAAAAGALLAAAAWPLFDGPPPQPSPMRFQLAPPPGSLGNVFLVAPDRRHGIFLAISGSAQALWLHSFETGESTLLDTVAGVNGGPFWSPDGRQIVYPTVSEVLKVDIAGGPPERVTATGGITGGAWSRSGDIILGQASGPILQMNAAGGPTRPVTRVDTARRERHSVMAFLPDGRRFLYLRTFGDDDAEGTGVFLGSLDLAPEAQSSTRVLAASESMTFAPSPDPGRGYILFYRGSTLMAQAFEIEAGRASSEPFIVADGLGDGQLRHVSASADGTLTFGSGGLRVGGTPSWVDRSGRMLGPVSPGVPDDALYPQLSPDGTRIAAVADGNVWVHHLDGRPAVKVTFEGNAFTPLWSRDGQRIVYEFGSVLRSMPADGSGGTPRAESQEGHYHAHGWSPDGGRLIAATFGSNETTWDLVDVPAGGGDPKALVATPAIEGIRGASLSPDGRWLAYSSNVTGEVEIWVRPYPGPGAAVRVSPGGGGLPVWSRDGRELFYTSGERLMAAAVEPGALFSTKMPRVLFESTSLDWSGQAPAYDVAADGRFVMLHRADAAPAPVTVVLNWAR